VGLYQGSQTQIAPRAKQGLIKLPDGSIYGVDVTLTVPELY